MLATWLREQSTDVGMAAIRQMGSVQPERQFAAVLTTSLNHSRCCAIRMAAPPASMRCFSVRPSRPGGARAPSLCPRGTYATTASCMYWDQEKHHTQLKPVHRAQGLSNTTRRWCRRQAPPGGSVAAKHILKLVRRDQTSERPLAAACLLRCLRQPGAPATGAASFPCTLEALIAAIRCSSTCTCMRWLHSRHDGHDGSSAIAAAEVAVAAARRLPTALPPSTYYNQAVQVWPSHMIAT